MAVRLKQCPESILATEMQAGQIGEITHSPEGYCVGLIVQAVRTLDNSPMLFVVGGTTWWRRSSEHAGRIRVRILPPGTELVIEEQPVELDLNATCPF